MSQGVRAELTARSRVLRVPAGSVIFGPGKSPENLLLLLEGTVRVQQTSETGREVFLYRVNAGESCVLTTACLLAYEDYSAEGIAETDLLAVVCRGDLRRTDRPSPDFRRFVFTAYSHRIPDLFHVIEEVAFGGSTCGWRRSCWRWRGGTCAQDPPTLAAELGTAREVISRQLQEFQRRGWVGSRPRRRADRRPGRAEAAGRGAG